MLKLRPLSGLAVASILAAVLGGCGGGGGGGLSSLPEAASVTASAGGQTISLWNRPLGGNGTTPPQPPSNVSLNSIIEFKFRGPVDVTSLPGWLGWVPGAPEPGPTSAAGSVNITRLNGTTPVIAEGSFSVVDDPNLPAGNARIVRFAPSPPSDPNDPAGTSGLTGNSLYTISVPAGGSSGTAVRVGGQPVSTAILAQFNTCDPTGPGGSGACFSDPIAGSPYVAMTVPGTGDPVGGALTFDPATIVNDTVQLFISEPLFPEGINRSNVRLINSNSGAQVPGDVRFFQAGSPQAGPSFALIEYQASSRLLASVTYEIEIDPAVRDFGGFPVELYEPGDPTAPASGRRLFATTTATFCEAAQPFFEDFTSTTNLDSVAGIGEWDTTTGTFRGDYPIDVIGDGAFGAMTFPPGPSSLDSGGPAVPGFAGDGVWNATSVTVGAISDVRLRGTLYPVHIRALEEVTIDGGLEGSAGNTITGILPPIGDPEQGAREGVANNGSPSSPTIVAGGVGGVGAGKGGDASQGGSTRTNFGQNGFGPATDFGGSRVLDPGPPTVLSPDTYGGAEGGESGLYLQPVAGANPAGGLGGAGGSAFAAGSNGNPRSRTTCIPYTQAQFGAQRISAAGAIPAVFTPPIMTLSAGSGGGGGGDRFEGATASTDDQGGGGGGGGGGLRISAIGNINLNAGSRLLNNGGTGNLGTIVFGGDGGGGSGGMIWLQSFSTLSINSTATISVEPGITRIRSAIPCREAQGGDGGIGVIQLEDSDASAINTAFIGALSGMGTTDHVLTRDFDFSSQIVGTALTRWFDTGYGDPDYIAVTESLNPGNVVCTGCPAIVIEYQGAFEDLSGGVPDLTTASAFTAPTGGLIDGLDGRRFIRARITMAFDLPTVGPGGVLMGNTASSILPTADMFSIRYATPLECP